MAHDQPHGLEGPENGQDARQNPRTCPFCDGGYPWSIGNPPPCDFCAGDGQVVPAGQLARLRDQLEATLGVMQVAKAVLERRMLSDERLALPRDEGMADAILGLDAALGGQ